MAQPQAFSDQIDSALRRSGLWEAPVDLDRAATGFPERIQGLIVSVQVEFDEQRPSEASMAAFLELELERHASRRCKLRITDSGQLTLPDDCGLPLKLDARLDPDGQRIKGRLVPDRGQPLDVNFARSPLRRAPEREFQGIWWAAQDDRVVAFRISYSLTGAVLVVQDSVYAGRARLGVVWSGTAHGHQLDAADNNRPGFNDAFLQASPVEDGKGLRAFHCGARMGRPCPVTFRRAEDEQALGAALRRHAQGQGATFVH